MQVERTVVCGGAFGVAHVVSDTWVSCPCVVVAVVVIAARKRAVLEWEEHKAETAATGVVAEDDDGDYTTFVEGTELDVEATKANMEAAAADLQRRKEVRHGAASVMVLWEILAAHRACACVCACFIAPLPHRCCCESLH